MEYNKIFY